MELARGTKKPEIKPLAIITMKNRKKNTQSIFQQPARALGEMHIGGVLPQYSAGLTYAPMLVVGR